MKQRAKVIGSLLSPYVRKVLACLDLKGVPYEIDPIVPFFGDDRFSQLSPVRRIPVLVDEQVTLADSSVICQYLATSTPRISRTGRAPAGWRNLPIRGWGRCSSGGSSTRSPSSPSCGGSKPTRRSVEKALREEIPQVLDYLETQAPAQGFLFGAISIADIALACFFRNAAFPRFRIDAARWPLTAAFVERALNTESFEKLKPLEDRLRRTPLGEHRAALAEMGVPLTQETYGTSKPRRGMMRID